MAVPSRRYRAGKVDIDNKEIERKKNAFKEEKKEITPEEHEARLNVLKAMGLIKESKSE